MALYVKNHASSPLYWQQFAPPGVTVETVYLTDGSTMNNQLQAGQLDMALFGPVNGLQQHEQGLGSKMIVAASRGGIGLVAKADQNMKELGDLKGKKIAIPPLGVPYLSLLSLLESAGLNTDKDVTLVKLGYADMPAALQRGDVDAYMGTEPLVTQSVLSGVGARLGDPYASPLGDLNAQMWASPALLGKPDVARAVAKMQRDASEHLSPGGQNDPAVWKDLLVTQFGYSEPVYEAVLPNIGARWKLDEKILGQIRGAGTLMKKLGLLTKEPDYEAVMDLSFQPRS